jgi:hypothetical protein
MTPFAVATQPRLIHFHAIGDHRGWLTPLEEHKETPFSVKRVYSIHGTFPDISRGIHANRDLEQSSHLRDGALHVCDR